MSMQLQVKLSQAKKMISDLIKFRLVPMVWGSPAIGKSSIVHQIAEEYRLEVIDVRLAQCDPTDLLGFPQISKETGKAGYVPMDTFPLEGDPLPPGKQGWLIFLDELTSAPRGVQAACYKLILDRMVGNHRLHKNVALVAAGNLETDNAIVEPMSTALQSRMVHMDVAVDSEEWLAWAFDNELDHRILSFIRFKPRNLYTFDANHTDRTYGSPRTWEFAHRIIKDHDSLDYKLLPLLAGTLSEGLAREFLGYCRIFGDLPTIAQICADPKGIPMPNEPSILYALTGAVSNAITPNNITPLMGFIERMPIEFQIITLRDVIRTDRAYLQNEHIRDWVSTKAPELF